MRPRPRSAWSGPAGYCEGRAIGIWAATSAVIGATGPVLGGWLIDFGSWRAIFLINLSFAVTMLFARSYILEDHDVGDEPRDCSQCTSKTNSPRSRYCPSPLLLRRIRQLCPI